MTIKIGPPMEEPTPEVLARVRTEWVDPITEAPADTQYCLYPTPARGADAQGSYLIYLPPGYAQDHSRRFPVIYWLHGGFGNARQGAWAVQNYAAAMQARQIPETIIVLVQALPVGWYVDSLDGQRPVHHAVGPQSVSRGSLAGCSALLWSLSCFSLQSLSRWSCRVLRYLS